MNALNGKVAVIGGASSGIGRAAALLFARQGAELVLGARRERLLAELVEDIRREGGGHSRWRATCAMKPSPNG